MALGSVMGLTFLLNLPFGWWREGSRKFSVAWFLAIHLPVPFIILVRQAFGVRLVWTTVPFLLLAYFLGQFAGSRLRARGAQGWTDVTGRE